MSVCVTGDSKLSVSRWNIPFILFSPISLLSPPILCVCIPLVLSVLSSVCAVRANVCWHNFPVSNPSAWEVHKIYLISSIFGSRQRGKSRQIKYKQQTWLTLFSLLSVGHHSLSSVACLQRNYLATTFNLCFLKICVAINGSEMSVFQMEPNARTHTRTDKQDAQMCCAVMYSRRCDWKWLLISIWKL